MPARSDNKTPRPAKYKPEDKWAQLNIICVVSSPKRCKVTVFKGQIQIYDLGKMLGFSLFSYICCKGTRFLVFTPIKKNMMRPTTITERIINLVEAENQRK